MEYTVAVATGGTYTLETRVAAVGAGGRFRILINGEDKTGLLNVTNTGAWDVYQVVQKTGVSLVSGIHTVRVTMVTAGASGHVGAFDWFRASASRAVRAAARTVHEPIPDLIDVRVNDEPHQPGAGWLAVDDDPATAWQGTASGGGGYLVLAFADAWNLAGLHLDWTSPPPADLRLFSSLDAQQWTEFSTPLSGNVVELQYLWLILPVADGAELPGLTQITVW
jgi:hypothetical protein